MQKNITIPVALQIRVDDVAWRHGADERFKNRPSRSGLPRDHHPLDYEMLHRLGKAQFATYKLTRTGGQQITIQY